MYDALEERRQVSGMAPNGNNAANVHGAGGAAVGGGGPLSNAGNLANGLEGGNHTGLLSSLNLTATPGPTSAQSHLKQGIHTFQQQQQAQAQQQQAQQQRQQQQQQQAQQKSLQMMNMASGGHGPFAPINGSK